MNYILQRFSSGKTSTLGALFAAYGNDQRQCLAMTLEDEHRDVKVPKETRIPAGRYQIKLRNAGGMTERYKRFPFHKGMLWLQDVPNFEWVYIHIGNREDQTDGCILVGDGCRLNTAGPGEVSHSEFAYRRVYLDMLKALDAGEEVWIDVRDYA
jgi:hypothetical protein